MAARNPSVVGFNTDDADDDFNWNTRIAAYRIQRVSMFSPKIGAGLNAFGGHKNGSVVSPGQG